MRNPIIDRRQFLATTAAAAGTAALAVSAHSADAGNDRIRVVVWDEQQPEQKQAYDGGFLGEAIAAHLKSSPDLSVRTSRFADSEQGLSDEILKDCDVLVWWSHFRSNPAIVPAKARAIVDRIKAGKMSLVTLHSAHWSAPFVQAMCDRSTEDALKTLSEEERKAAQVIYVTPKPFTVPKRTDPLTPSSKKQIV